MTESRSIPMVRPLVALLAALAMVVGLAGAPAHAQDAAGSTIQNLQFDTVLDGIGDGEFVGRIVNLTVGEDGLASGRIIGQLLDDEGNLVQRVNEAFEDFDITGLLDVDNGDNGECQILFLELGPLFLDLLGLIVEIPDPVIVEIRAEEGPGNLLGNLLCAVAGLLD